MNEIRLGRVFLALDHSQVNYHGVGSGTICGWKIIRVDITKSYPQTYAYYTRFILYTPAGAWWMLDICLRKKITT